MRGISIICLFLYFYLYNKITLGFQITEEMQRGVTSHSLPKHNLHAPLPKRFPEDIQCILEGAYRDSGSIYISNIEAAENPNTLKRLNIKSVLSCAKGYELKHDKSVVKNYLYIPAVDHQSFDISVYLDKGVDFITANLAHSNVLVHCIAGVSRSVTMVIAYFMREHQMNFQQAYKKVKSKRHIINPNPGFVSALQQYQRDLSKKRSYIGRSYASPPKDERKTATTATDFPSKQELAQSSTFYELMYNPGLGYSSRYKEKTPEPKHSQSVSKKPTTQLFQQKYAEKLIEKEPAYSKTRDHYDSDYFQSLNAELQEKIQRIRQKYDVQRQQLKDKYHSRRTGSDYPEDHIHNLSKYNRYETNDYRYTNLKTESTDPKSAKLYQPRQYKYIDVNDLFPKKFHHQSTSYRETSPKKDQNSFYTTSQNIYLSRQTPLSNSKYGVNDSLRYKKYENPNNYNMLNSYGLKRKYYS